MIERTLVGRSGRAASRLGKAGLLLSGSVLLFGSALPFAAVLLFTSACGSSSTDEQTRARPEQGDDTADDDASEDDASEASDDDANEASDDDASDDAVADDGNDPDEGGPTGPSTTPDEEEVATLCDELCDAWADCEEAGGPECVDECSGFTASTAGTGCYPLVAALYDCIRASGECPEQAPCETEANALGRCADGSAVSSGDTVATPPLSDGSASSGSSSGSSGSGSSGGGVDNSDPLPNGGAVPSDPQPSEGEADADPTEHFGGEDMTPEAILEAAELAQCSEFEVDEFACGSSGYSSGGALCTGECYDPDDRVWSSLCRDGVCRCQYEGITYCQCPHEGMTETGCNSCCPQLADADFEF